MSHTEGCCWWPFSSTHQVSRSSESSETEKSVETIIAKAATRIQNDAHLQKKSEWKRCFKDLSTCGASPEQLATVLETITKEMAEQMDANDDPFKMLDRLLGLMPPEIVTSALQQGETQFDPATFATQLQTMAKVHALVYKDTLPPDLRKRLQSVWKSFSGILFVLLENCVKTLGFSELFKPTTSVPEQTMRMNKLMLTITIYTALSAALTLWLGAQGTIVFGGFISVMVFLSVAYNKIKPLPSGLPIPGSRNLTLEYESRRLPHVEVEHSVLAQIVDALRTPRGNMQQPLIIGPSGVGKTTVLYALTKALKDGKYGPDMQKKQIYFIEGAALRDANHPDMFGTPTSILEKINEALGDHLEDAIICIDELHELWKSKDNNLGSQLKNRMSGGSRFPRIIGTTTYFDYHEYMVSDPALFRRFAFVQLESPSKEQVVHTLRKGLPAWIRVSNELLEHLYDIVPKEGPLPPLLAAKQVLDACVKKLEESRKPTTDGAEKIKRQREEELTRLFFIAIDDPTKRDSVQTETIQIDSDREAEKQTEPTRKAFAKECIRYDQIQSTIYKRAGALSTGKSPSRRQKKQIHSLAIIDKFLQPAIRTHLGEKAKNLSLQFEITVDFIKEVHDEQQEIMRSILERVEKEAKASKGFENGANLC